MALKELRLSKGLTQQELAELIRKDRSLIAKIESENSSPSIETAKALADVFGVPWTIFFEEQEG